MKIIKRSGAEAVFDISKIIIAINKANHEVVEAERLTADQIKEIAQYIEDSCKDANHALNVEDIQDLVEDQLMDKRAFSVARKYITYRYKRALVRKSNSTDEQILSLIECNNEEVKQENSNKDSTVNSVQRDYMAGEVSKDITRRFLLPEDIVAAHEQGIIHFHDADYFAQHMHNCDLVNLEDMLQNGTVISGTRIDKPHSFSTACNIATQIIAQVASSQYGGQSISLAHLVPFVQISREKIHAELVQTLKESDVELSEEKINSIVERRLHAEIERGVQVIQYQVVTLMTTNGQSPFVTVFMYLNEAKNECEKADLAMLIEEMLHQRIQGVKSEKGVYIAPAFPKLIYVLEEDNITEDSKYWYLTELAAKCTSKRLVPDYISEKMMLELKGDVYTCMGCVDGKELITYKIKNNLYVESFERMWRRLSDSFEIKHQYSETNPNLYMDLSEVTIYDTEKGFVETKRIIRNVSSEWLDVDFSNGRRLLCTTDHPLTLRDGRNVHASELKLGDKILINSNQYNEESILFNTDKAWLLGFMLCDGCYQNNHVFASIAATGEDEIEEKFSNTYTKYFGLNVKTILQERGKKGTYKDLCAISDNNGGIQYVTNYFTSKFGGINKVN